MRAMDVPESLPMSGHTAVLSGGYGSTGSVNDDGRPTESRRLIPSGRATPVMASRHPGTDVDTTYEKLYKDSVPCPTCRGLGRVPRDQEGELIALIPMKDKRLKPSRTVPYVGLAIALCLLATGLCAFFLFPRDVVITSNRPLLEPLKLQLNYSASFVNITVVNFYNFINNNFNTVKILGAQMTAVYKQRVMAIAANHTDVTVPMKSVLSYSILMSIVPKEDDLKFLVKYCVDSRPMFHNLQFKFEILANYTYLGNVQQASLTTYQQVSCFNASAYWDN